MTKPDAVKDKCSQCIWWKNGVGCTEDSGPVYDYEGDCIWFDFKDITRFLEGK